MPRPETSSRPGRLAPLGLVILTATGLLGCPGDDVNAEGNETGGGCGVLAGDLVISEIVANVDGADEGQEWFEIYNASADTIDLEGLTLVYERGDGTGHKTHTVARSVEVAPGGYVVVGGLLDELAMGTDHVDYGWGGDLGELGNTDGYLAITCDDQIIDEVLYQDPVDTASRSLDGSQAPDAIANDNLDGWCDSRTEFSAGFAATPGAANDVCGSATTCGDGQELTPPVAGDLVITEVLPNPDVVADDVGEWFEIHSLAAGDVTLNGLQLGKSLEDAAEDTIADAACVVLSPGEYALVAASADMAANGGLPADAVVWETSMSLTNNDGSLWIGYADEVLDAVSWGSAGAGEAIQLDPDFYDPTANDDPANWCDATESFGAGDLGTPGAANSECMIPPPDGQCYDNGELRDIVPVDMGDLEITELLPNPDVVDDGAGEWFEVRVKSSGDLNGLEIGKAGGVQDTVDFGDALGFEPDACVAVTAGQFVVFAHQEADNGGIPQVDVLFDMALNNSGSDLFIGYEGVVWDQVTWDSSTAGASLSKDAMGTWCDGVDVYGDGDLGTPGSPNPACGGGPDPDMCVDPDTMLMRQFNKPAMDALTLTEIMPDPSGAPDATGEWFEFHTSVEMDLNGLQIGKNDVVSHTVASETCLEIAADSYVVLARSDVDNCDLPALDYVYADFSLNNSGGNLQIGYDDAVFSEHSWASSTAGAAHSYDEMAMSWCLAVDPYGCGDLGTPGAVNPACGMGNMDGMCLDGMMMRAIVPPTPGDLVISEFMANPAAVSDAAGEWFEIHALAAFDLNGLELGRAFIDGPMDTVDAADCVALAPGDNALLARNADPMQNGNLPPVDFVIGFGLTNSNSALHVASEGVLLDEVAWTSVATGASTSLDPDSLDPNVNDVANNDGVIWCYEATPYGDGDNGTPAADNGQCN